MARTRMITFVAIAGILVFTACSPQPAAPAGGAQLPNPASVYCEEHGGTLEIRTAADGSQSGICRFPDGSECDEWAYFRSECKPGDMAADASDMDLARAALTGFFDALHEGRYEDAVALYGASYEELIDLNPNTNPDDHAALLEQACKINGFQCLKIKQILDEAQPMPDTYSFTVEFANRDGSAFVLEPCCGGPGTDAAPQTEFEFTVMRVSADGSYRVQRLPVFVP